MYSTHKNIEDFLRGYLEKEDKKIRKLAQVNEKGYNSYKWRKLITAAAYYGYDWNCRAEGAHNSLADCYATLYVFKKLQKQVEADSDKI